jgi:hypothetical protein
LKEEQFSISFPPDQVTTEVIGQVTAIYIKTLEGRSESLSQLVFDAGPTTIIIDVTKLGAVAGIEVLTTRPEANPEAK